MTSERTSQTNAPTLVLVTGSMRSGTSSLAGSLKALGFHVPQPEVPASPRNAKGHFEPRWVIEFHKRLLREALVRPSDGSPRALPRVEALADESVRTELADWLAAQPQPRVVVKDPHAAWLLGTWRAAAEAAGRDLRLLTALRHPAEVVGSQDLTWGEGRRTDAERRVKETSNTAAWLNVALVTERASRGAPRAFVRYDDLLADWRTALGRVSAQLDLGLDLAANGAALDAFLDPGMRRSQLTWADLEPPGWLQALAQQTWDHLGGLVDDPRDADAMAGLDAVRGEYDARYAEAVALTLDEARHRERRGSAQGAAKLRGRLRAERDRRQRAESRAESRTARATASGERSVAQRAKRALGQILVRSRSGNRSATKR